MGRPQKTGLSFFPLDVDFFEDKRIRRMTARFGADGPMLYLYVLCKAYENGYYIDAGEDFTEDAAMDLGCSAEKIGLMLHYLLDKSLLDGTLFSTVKVLSSHGIQAQYQRVMEDLKRDVEVDGAFWILDSSETKGFIKVRQNSDKSEKNPSKSGKNSSKSEENALKENKIKENKRKKNKGDGSAERFTPPTLEDVKAYCKERNSSVDAKRFFDYFEAGNWVDGKGNPVRNWKQKLITWERNNNDTTPQEKPAKQSENKREELDAMQRMYNKMKGGIG